MAIFVDVPVTASPNPTSLPRRVEFEQTLRSTQDGEQIDVAYSLSAAHDVWFEDSDGSLQKQVVRQETVSKTAEVFVDRITMRRGPGQGGMLAVEVSQAIRDSLGNVTPGLVVVQLES